MQMSCFYYMYSILIGIISQINDEKFMASNNFLQSSCHYLDSRGIISHFRISKVGKGTEACA